MQSKETLFSMKRIYLIDYLKAISIIMVIFTHYDWQDKTTLFFTLLIAMAVPIFMIISGFNFTMSYEKIPNQHIKQLYTPSGIGHRLYRFLLPFIMIYIPEMFLHPIIRKEHFTGSQWVYYFITGGLGPGSYYIPVLIVMLFCFPLIFICVRRFSYLGVFFIGILNLIYEVFVHYNHMESFLYRLLFFRYLLYTAFGCYMYFYFQNRKKYPLSVPALILMFMTGLSFSLAIYQFHWQPPIFHYWTKTAMPIALYIFPILFFLMYFYRNKKIPGILGNILTKIGQASYHIFLIQMVYYRLFDDIIFPPKPALLVVCGNIIITLSVGYIFYLLETKLSKKILKLCFSLSTKKTK